MAHPFWVQFLGVPRERCLKPCCNLNIWLGRDFSWIPLDTKTSYLVRVIIVKPHTPLHNSQGIYFDLNHAIHGQLKPIPPVFHV